MKTIMKTTVRNSEFHRVGLFALLLMLIFVMGCENEPTEVEDYNPEPVLTAFIENGKPVEQVRLRRVGGFYDYYDPTRLGIEGATIKLYPVKEADGSDADSTGRVLYFTEDANESGIYLPVDNNYLPQAMVRYRLTAVKSSEGVDMWAETSVPDTLTMVISQNNQVVDIDGDTLTREDPELSFDWSESAGAGGYQLGILAMNPRDQLVPLDPEYDPTDEDMVEAYEEQEAYLYTIAPDYQTSYRIPWLFYVWAGPTRIDVTACSPEYYDYVFTKLSLQGGDELPLTNVHGGLGIFGAVSQQTVEIYMEISGI